jgi:membrane protein DedA with SNARE-associated domain
VRDAATDAPARGGGRPPKWVMAALVAPIAAMVVATNVAALMWATLVDTHPLVLVALSPINRYLALTTNQLDAWSYYLVGGLRLLAPDPFFYALGLLYGDRALRWVQRRLPSWGQMVTWLEKAFERAAWPIVFAFPNNPVSLLAGATRLPFWPFLAVNIAGTLTRLWLIRLVGEAFASPIGSALGFVRDWRWPLLALSAAALALSFWSERRRGGGELGALRHLSSDLEEPEEEPEPAPPSAP